MPEILWNNSETTMIKHVDQELHEITVWHTCRGDVKQTVLVLLDRICHLEARDRNDTTWKKPI